MWLLTSNWFYVAAGYFVTHCFFKSKPTDFELQCIRWPVGGTAAPSKLSLTSLIAQFDKRVTGLVLDFRWMILCYTHGPASPPQMLLWSRLRRQLEIPRPLKDLQKKKKNLLRQWPQNMPGAVFRHLKFGRKWKGIKRDEEELLILDLSARFQMLNLISAEEVRARRLCPLFSSGEDVEVPHVCSCV